jgi:hypothetical protein
MRLRLLLLAVTLPAQLLAQTKAQRAGAATITEADVMRRIHVIAHDSMGGRDTPSRGLDLTAAWIAAEFKRLGLRPGGDSGSFLQRYPIEQYRVVHEKSVVTVSGPGGPAVTLQLDRDAALQFGAASRSGGVVLIGGPLDSLQGLERIKGKAAVVVADFSAGTPPAMRQLMSLIRAQPALVLVVNNNDSLFARTLATATRPRTLQRIGDADPAGVIVVVAKESAILAQLPQAGEQLATIRGAQRPVLLEMPEWTVDVALVLESVKRETAPNAVGILEGSDPVLRQEYLVYSAHMDHVGMRRGPAAANGEPADSIFNGADDDASGTVGVIELAEAFAARGARPKRSVIFVAVSGEEKGLWGSDWFATHPPVPVGQMVANLNADMIGRNWPDSIVVIGTEHSDLGETLARVSARHPELRMAALDDRWPEQNFYQRSDHYHFARRGVPVLFFFNGTHDDYHRASDHPDKINGEKLARIAQLMYWIGQEVGNAPERPKWKPESYEKYVTER